MSIDVIELRKDVAKLERLKLEDIAEKFINHRNLADTTAASKENYRNHLTKLLEVVKKVVRTTLKVDVSALSKVGGKKALYFVFDSAKKGHSICDVEDFRFTAK